MPAETGNSVTRQHNNNKKKGHMGRHSATTNDKTKTVLGGLLAGMAVGTAGFALAAPASAEPSTSVRCSPCASQPAFVGDTIHTWQRFSGDLAEQWTSYPGRLQEQWTSFPGRLAGQWNSFPGELADKWKNFPSDLGKQWGVKAPAPSAPSAPAAASDPSSSAPAE